MSRGDDRPPGTAGLLVAHLRRIPPRRLAWWAGRLAALPALQESGAGAAIVNISTSTAKSPQPPLLHYAAAKAALATYSKGLARALAPAGIRVNLLTPGRVETPGGMEIVQTIADATGTPVDALAQNVPLGRFGDARDIAEAVAFLVSNRSQWITGSDLDVNGGQ